MSQATEDFKDMLVKQKGKLRSEHLPKIITFVDGYMKEFSAGKEEAHIIQLLGEAFDMDPQRLQDIFECGTKALAAFTDDFSELVPDGLGKLYVQWLNKTEPPPSFNFFSFLTVVGALLGRQHFTHVIGHAVELGPNIFQHRHRTHGPLPHTLARRWINVNPHFNQLIEQRTKLGALCLQVPRPTIHQLSLHDFALLSLQIMAISQAECPTPNDEFLLPRRGP